MSEIYAKIGELLDLQRVQAERVLSNIVQQQNRLLETADKCHQASRLAQNSSNVRDIASSSATEKWLQAQYARVKKLRADAEALQPEIIRCTAQLHVHLRKQTGFEELQKIRKKKRALQEEERADDEMLNIVQLGRNGRLTIY